MGEYAEAAIWAMINGCDPTDMSPDEWAAFYDEEQYCKQKRSKKTRCPKCGKKLRSAQGVKDHLRDFHKEN